MVSMLSPLTVNAGDVYYDPVAQRFIQLRNEVTGRFGPHTEYFDSARTAISRGQYLSAWRKSKLIKVENPADSKYTIKSSLSWRVKPRLRDRIFSI